MNNFIIRLQQEKNELSEKIHKLKTFIDSEAGIVPLSHHEKGALFEQLKTMERYYGILNQRLYFYQHGIWPFDNTFTTKKETTMEIMKYFEYSHLPQHLQEVSKPIGELAKQLDEAIPNGAEKTAGMRKLLEAKDCLVRAKLG